MSEAYGILDFAALAAASGSRPLPPVHLWDPPNCGEIDIRIDRGGGWCHEGSPIGRAALVRLFSTVLRKDADGFFLVTPVEKLRIVVEDAPFVAVSLDAGEGRLRFVTNVGDAVVADADHPIAMRNDDRTGAAAPYVLVRGGLEARLTRAVFYQLVELAEPCDGPEGLELCVTSRGARFSLGRVDEA